MFLNLSPDLLGFQRQSRITAALKARLEQTSREAVTGRREDIGRALGGDIGSVHLLQKSLDDIEQNSRIYALSEARLNLMSASLSSIRGVIGQIDTIALGAISTPDDFGITTIAAQAEANIRSVFSLLSTAHGNRKLFAGDATDQIPLAKADVLLADITTIMQNGASPQAIETALDSYFNDTNGGFATNIYKGGDNDAPPTFLADGSKIEFGVKANDPALKEVIRGLAMLATAQSSSFAINSNQFRDIFVGAAGIINKGKGGIIKLEGGLGIYSGLLEKSSQQQTTERLALSENLNKLVGRDQYEAAAELKQLESQLKASYLITSRLADLHLTNFIR